MLNYDIKSIHLSGGGTANQQLRPMSRNQCVVLRWFLLWKTLKLIVHFFSPHVRRPSAARRTFSACFGGDGAERRRLPVARKTPGGVQAPLVGVFRDIRQQVDLLGTPEEETQSNTVGGRNINGGPSGPEMANSAPGCHPENTRASIHAFIDALVSSSLVQSASPHLANHAPSVAARAGKESHARLAGGA